MTVNVSLSTQGLFCLFISGVLLLHGKYSYASHVYATPSSIDGKDTLTQKIHLSGNPLRNHRLTRERYLALTDSIICPTTKSSPGDFCGAKLYTVYKLADSANFTGSNVFEFASNRTASYHISEYVFKYKTQVRNGTVIDATGIIMLPRGLSIPEGHPILMFGHGTVGSNDEAAPSATLDNLDFFLSLELNGMRNFATIGFMVVVPDYAGLGVSDIHGYYLVKKPTAYSVIDSVRSSMVFAQKQGVLVSRNTAFIGHSQGGSAVLQALEVYDGPEAYGKSSFDVKVVVPLAPAPVFRYSFYAGYSLFYSNFAASIFSSYLYAASIYNTNLSIATLLSPLAVNLTTSYVPSVSVSYMLVNNLFPANSVDYFSPVAIAATQYNFNGLLCYTGNPSCQGGLPPLTLSVFTFDPIPADWQRQMDEDSPGYTLTSSVPIRLLQGTADTVVNPLFTIPLAQKLATNGAVLVDKEGKPIMLNPQSLISELGKTSNCTNQGLFLQCGLSHAEISFAMDQYVPLVLSQVQLPIVKKRCSDDPNFYMWNNTRRTCNWIAEKEVRTTRYCSKMRKYSGSSLMPIYTICQAACGFCR